jgi:hypothetical protein
LSRCVLLPLGSPGPAAQGPGAGRQESESVSVREPGGQVYGLDVAVRLLENDSCMNSHLRVNKYQKKNFYAQESRKDPRRCDMQTVDQPSFIQTVAAQQAMEHQRAVTARFTYNLDRSGM